MLNKFDEEKLITSSEKLILRREVDTKLFTVPNGRYSIVIW